MTQFNGLIGFSSGIQAVETDGVTITGDGTEGDPLVGVAEEVEVDGTTVTGTGLEGDPLVAVRQTTIVDGTSITGTGVTGSPLVAPPRAVVVDGTTVTGSGLTGNALVAVRQTTIVDGTTITGTGVTGSPLVAARQEVFTDGETITGDGSEGDPLVVIGGGGGAVVTDGVTITGDGTEGDPLVVVSPDVLILVNDVFSVVEDVPEDFDLFANDEPEGEWSVLDIRVPNVVEGGAPAIHAASDAAISVPGHGTIVVNEDGTGTITPLLNVHGAWPSMVVVSRGPSSSLRYSTVSITVTPVNDAPVARDIAGISIFDPVEETLTDVVIDLYGAISDPDGDAVELTLINAGAVVYDTPIDLDGATLTIDEETGLGTIVMDEGRETPVTFTYTCSDGSLTSTGDVEIIIAQVQNRPMVSPVAPFNAASQVDEERLAFFQTYMQSYGPLWPNIGPPDEGGNLTLVTMPPYSAGQGAYVLTTQEPWLYNRCRVAYLMWRATGNPDYRDVAIEWIELYFAGMGPSGTWVVGTVDPQDAKYKYPENADFYRELTADRDGNSGSTVYFGNASALYAAMATSAVPEYDAGSDELFTERNQAYGLRAEMREFYRSGGDEDILAEATVRVDLILEMSEASGAPLHGHNKHEGSAITTPISSPWMTGILMEDMLQYYRHTRREDVLAWIYNYGLWVIDEALYVADHNEEPEFAGLEGLRIPAYLAGTGVQFPEGTAADMRHCRDVGVVMDKARWAGEQLEEDVTAITAARDELRLGALVDDAYWTRETPLYAWKRVNPSRSHAWMFAHYYALLYDTGTAPPIAPAVIEEGSISGSTQQGSTLTYTPGEYSGTPSPTETWVWQLAGEDITGTENDLTFDSVDVGATTVHVTVANDGGTVEYDTNTITVVPAGAPEWTEQPTAQSVAEDDELVFSGVVVGIPAPTVIAQYNDGGGWATATGGTLDDTTDGNEVTVTWTVDEAGAELDGYDFRFLADNDVGDPVPSDEVGISIVAEQPAMVTTAAAQYVRVNVGAGGAGTLNATWMGWLKVVTPANLGSVLRAECNAGRSVDLLCLNGGSQELSIGDSQTGVGTGWATPFPTNTWCWVTVQTPTTHPGTFRATYRAAGSDTTYVMTRANGIEDTPTIQSFLIGGGSGAGATVHAQHVRAFNSRLTDQQCIDMRDVFDPTSGSPVFFVVATDGGGGALAVTDLSGNAVDVDIVGATLTTSGPVTGSVS